MPFWIIPTLRWDAETFGKGLALDLVFLNFCVYITLPAQPPFSALVLDVSPLGIRLFSL